MPLKRYHLTSGAGVFLAIVSAWLSRTVEGRLAVWGVLALGALAVVLLLAAMLQWGRQQDAEAMGRIGRRYARDVTLGMGAYLVVLVASLQALKRVDDTTLRVLLAIAPVLPIALVLRAMVRYVRDSDELQRRIELESVSIASALVSLLYMTGGFLQSAKVIAIPAAEAMLWVFPLTCLVYGVAKLLVGRRYG